jgi:hypothetical protein
VSESTHPVLPEQSGGTTGDDHRTALRFVLGRPGWQAATTATAQGGAYLSITTPCPKTGGQRSWRVVRTRQGLLVRDEASERRPVTVATMRDALVGIWETVTDAAPD